VAGVALVVERELLDCVAAGGEVVEFAVKPPLAAAPLAGDGRYLSAIAGNGVVGHGSASGRGYLNGDGTDDLIGGALGRTVVRNGYMDPRSAGFPVFELGREPSVERHPAGGSYGDRDGRIGRECGSASRPVSRLVSSG
jgi:hypothetical protein